MRDARAYPAENLASHETCASALIDRIGGGGYAGMRVEVAETSAIGFKRRMGWNEAQ